MWNGPYWPRFQSTRKINTAGNMQEEKSEKKKILIIEDDKITLNLLLNFFKQYSEVSAEGSKTLKQGVDLVSQFDPDIIISDIELPDGLGIQIMSVINTQEKRVPVIFITGFLDEYKGQIPHSSQVTVMGKPLSLQDLWENIKDKLYQEEATSPFVLSDYLQLATQGKHSVKILWENHGVVIIKNGELWSATDAKGTGEDALRRLIVRSEIYRDGGYIYCEKLSNHNLGEQNLSGRAEHIVLRAVSEEEVFLQTIPNQSSFLSNLRKEAEFDELLDEAVTSLLKKKYAPALTLFLKAQKLVPNNKTVNINISRLKEMGIKPEEEL
ncbi:MAG: hypothetical protein CSA81_13040 [Acidobacteria bacterium]|nr:MAG: hypothetical protein CSA81_13040 [Acidobacteriota bacterium]PIE89144.1 MAG: hypothetical protein CR997_12780 [Acidobacteriota bacterium]